MNTENGVNLNIELVAESVSNEETSANIGDEINTIINSKMVDKSCQTEVEIDWNNNLVDEMEVSAMNEEPFENTFFKPQVYFMNLQEQDKYQEATAGCFKL